MRLFKSKNKDKKAKIAINKSAAKNSILFAIGCLISALSFNLFFVPYNFVGGGLSGVAIVINNIFDGTDNDGWCENISNIIKEIRIWKR